MIDKTHMTIDAYLRQAGVTSAPGATPARLFSLTSNADTPFKAMLDAAATADRPSLVDAKEGMTIADYLNRRLGVKPLAGMALDRFGWAFRRFTAEPAPADGAGRAPTSACGDRVQRSIARAAKKYRLSPELIDSVIRAESDFRVDAVSPAGAQGLMQLMPATAAELGVEDPFDVRQNIDGGSKYLRQMLDRFDGDLKLALAAYNAGPGTVERYQGDVPYEETRTYVQKVLSGIESAGTTVI